ncbi:hypothetical protein E4631_21060 [Hymenobacter sp. UV11]|uniref:hypothetical protein n=1 Tax=Hymenobacter sp. UV11 TaxID=1849735 RepID=UPI0010621313|nr:hypothetical protein [Hymenobacter sp. UV11]TDN38796.1 hypothetical protein A8B98_21755 [Hymenobacter sp. UV11]TFZ63787.1 hypothetical protein E4631_21060 [Hymenobacter sp. UV11]
MRSSSRTSATGLPRAASRHDPGTVSPATLHIAQEADASMSPDSWESNYAPPAFVAEASAASPVFSVAGASPAA